jgi:hypothetical protein
LGVWRGPNDHGSKEITITGRPTPVYDYSGIKIGEDALLLTVSFTFSYIEGVVIVVCNIWMKGWTKIVYCVGLLVLTIRTPFISVSSFVGWMNSKEARLPTKSLHVECTQRSVTYTGCVVCSVTNNSTRVRIGYRIYSLWRHL